MSFNYGSQKSRQEAHLKGWEKISTRVSKSNYGEEEIDRIGDVLGISESAKKMSQQILEQSRDKDLIHGRLVDRVIASCVYISCRIEENGHSIDDISSATSVSKSDISSMSKKISESLGLEISFATPENYIEKFIKDVNRERRSQEHIPFGEDVRSRAREILEVAHDEGLVSGKSPTGVAAAAIYLAGKQLGYKHVTQQDVSNVSSSATTTIRERYQEQEAAWEERKSS